MSEHNPGAARDEDGEMGWLDQVQLESRVKSAANYVRPSEFFRARVLDDARQWQADRRTDRTILRNALALACSVALSVASLHSVHVWFGERFESWSSEHMQTRASQIATQQRLSADDSLTEAFWESRAELAARWPMREPSANP